MEEKAYLLLEDGTYYEGKHGGTLGTTTGEICFNTGMTGYQEVFTDPSYFGQILVTTNAHIGNYGITKNDNESNSIQISGLVCKNLSDHYSRNMANSNVDSYFKDNNIVVIYDLDTRAIVRHIRSKGAMNCVISSEMSDKESLIKILEKTPSMEGLELASKVSTNEQFNLGDKNAVIHIGVLDFGVKNSILKCIAMHDAYITVFPAKTQMSELKKHDIDGYFLSNGPGDPAAMDYAVDTVKEIMKIGKPIFGICLGHQILALANGISTYKMHHGHRGINHPVLNLKTGKCEVTSQNHGFGVSRSEIEKSNEHVTITHRNLNDDTVEGIRINNKPFFSVQYHPEASPGPHDSRYLFENFIQLIKAQK